MTFDVVDFSILLAVAGLTAAYFFYKKKPTKPTKPKLIVIEKLQKSFLDSAQVILFFGSQTGTAEDLANRFAKDLNDYSISTLVCDFEDYEMTDLLKLDKSKLVCFFMATYGEGEPTDNSNTFYDWVMQGQGRIADEGKASDDFTSDKVFQDISFVSFGLGNKTYTHYNAIMKRLTNRLILCGANLISELGLGDDDGSLEEDFLKWKDPAVISVAAYFGLKPIDKQALPHIPIFNLVNKGPINDSLLDTVYCGEITSGDIRRWKKIEIVEDYEVVEKRVDVTFLEVSGPKRKNSITDRRRSVHAFDSATDIKNPYYSRIDTIYPLFQNNFDDFKFDNCKLPNPVKDLYSCSGSTVKIIRQCFHIDLDISPSKAAFKTGDHVGVWPENSSEEVVRLARAVNLFNELDNVIELVANPENKNSSTIKLPFSVPCTYRTALTYYVDLSSVLKQYHFEIFAKYANDDEEREILIKLSKDRELFVAAIEKPLKSLAETLEEFKSIELPISVVLSEILTRIQLRYYSISSSSLKDPTKVGITAVVVRFAIENPKIKSIVKGIKEKVEVIVKQGLTTSYFQRLYNSRSPQQLADSANLDSAESIPKFHLPIFKLPDHHIPIIMVGPGTGAAPFRGFLWERYVASKTSAMAQTIFYYGCRHPDNDRLYKNEFDEIGKQDWVSIKNAFSRNGGKKVYVQQLVKEDCDLVWDILENRKGVFYVCGDAKNMATAVYATLVEVAMIKNGLDEEGGKEWVKRLKSGGRYLEDTWS